MSFGDKRTQAEKDAANRADRSASEAMRTARSRGEDVDKAYAKVISAASSKGVKF
jgi:hypothetical protein